MIPDHIIHVQWIPLGIIIFIQSTTSDIIFPDITSIVIKDPIVNATMYAAYPNLWDLDMSNQTAFEFPVEQVLLIHDELNRFVCNNCGVHSIYRESLSKLPLLTHLMMENNSLRYVHADAFEHNSRLEKVNLAGNQLSTFNPEATIRNIPGLAMLDLSWNEEFDLNRVDLRGRRLFFFTCNHCNTTFLDKKSLIHMPRLSQLYLSYNGVERIDDDSLATAKYVKILNVDGNRGLQQLHLESESLKKLSAEGCSLQGTLNTAKLPMLEYINVRSNRIEQVNEQGFRDNPAINVVLLDDNLITKAPTVLLELPLNALKQLCLDLNPLQPSPLVNEAKTLYTTRCLRKDCLDDANHLNKFEIYLPNVRGYAVYRKKPIHQLSSDRRIVDLSNRAIVYIEPDYLIDEHNVTAVLFDHNHLFNFEHHREFLKSSTVERMSLKNCSITAIYEETFMQLPNLEYLHLEHNKIQSIYSNSLFRKNTKLKFLSLSQNNLEFITAQAFQGLEELQNLHLDWNDRLSNDANTVFLLSKSLQKLSCKHCRFERLDNMTLIGLPNLTELNLDHNYIATLDVNALQRTTELKRLNLRHNHLVIFEPNFNRLTHLKALCLAGNPNFDLEHPRNFAAGDDISKMIELHEACPNPEEEFFNKLVQRFQERKKVVTETTPPASIEYASLRKGEASSAMRCTIDVFIPLLMGFVSYFINL